ncbi:vacuolar protein sorting-associated protein 13D-like [Oncorhynchus tshawytscha]|uniref:vacuolar protein sorting-associated protein 13D-like n=1 Tax=Oncorhynchus tshawytscha TaxID=74940 RepID=UPI001C3CB699|nr:vacuolar protein sorting-associated protein 13D-like [Oncorhynchus tshawytscha]XP_042155269.1 vacuolar protein sorting-associated protein 13D-like [Oncorhynchus tshawytscha]XP_042155270.1 vacuolar protein sorting-associated protein 13D-like [Oncorhynchus tshawytscha]
MMNVSLELLDSPKATGQKPCSLARFDFIKSKLLFESFSNGSKSVNPVSHSILAYDTRYTWPGLDAGSSARGKHNVFDCILQPRQVSIGPPSSWSCITGPLRTLPVSRLSSTTCVLLIFDWLQLVWDFLHMHLSRGTEFVVVKDSSCLDTNAIILKGTTVLPYKPCLLDRPFSGSLAGIAASDQYFSELS